MPPINVLIKPASSACNMCCSYCFYQDVASHRESAFQGMLSPDMLEGVVASAMAYAEGSCTFLFQGGEPTLAGLDFYRRLIALEEKHVKPGVKVYHAIQTNGYALNEAWCAFFREHRFLVGVSLDGPADLHNLNRKDRVGKHTYNQVMRGISLLERFGVAYNILCVLTGRNARSIQRIYQFYRNQGFRWLQFIPCLEPLGQTPGKEPYHLSVDEYGDFLIRIFDLWMDDLRQGKYVSIRHIDNWLQILMGGQPESCGMTGHCSIQFVVEGDGGVYPCDFYVLDEYRLGTVGETSFVQMAQSPVAEHFLQTSCSVPESCNCCPYYVLCRNGCRRERVSSKNGYCSALYQFFSQRIGQLRDAAALIQRLNGHSCRM